MPKKKAKRPVKEFTVKMRKEGPEIEGRRRIGTGIRWTPSETAALKEELKGDKRLVDIAWSLSERFGRPVSKDSVAQRASRLGLTNFKEKDAPVAAAAPSADDRLVNSLVKLTRKRPMSFEALCDRLDLAPLRLRRLAAMAEAKGFAVQIEGNSVGRPPSAPGAPEKAFEIIVSKTVSRHVIAVVGDIHFGSKHHLGPQFKAFCEKAYARGARQFLQVGDLLDGVYRHSIWEQAQRGFEDQVAYALENLPKWKDATWHFIQGNHDETFGDQSGLDTGRAIVERFAAAGRKDIVYHGARGGYVRLATKKGERGLFVELWHPRGNAAAYAKSYKLQRKIAGYAPGTKPDCLAMGHYHQSMYFVDRGVHALGAGCWHGSGSSFGKSLGNAPDIGSWIVEYGLTKEGTVREFSPTWIGHYETETVRDISLS